MSANAPDSGASRTAARVLSAIPEVAIVATVLLFVPLLNDLGQTTTIFGVSLPTAAFAAIFWVLGVLGGGIFTFRRRSAAPVADAAPAAGPAAAGQPTPPKPATPNTRTRQGRRSR